MTTRDTKLVLRKGRKLIETCGWTQGEYRDNQGRMCALGSLRAASNALESQGELDDDSGTVYLDAVDALREVVNIGGDLRQYTPIPDWNDAPDRTKDEVLNALESAELYIR